MGYERAKLSCPYVIPTIDLFKKYGARCTGNDLKNNFIKETGLKNLICNPKEIAALWGAPSQISKSTIPHTLHQIWLTNEKNPKEVRESDIQKTIENHAKFSALNNFKHILWTNSPTSIPNTVKKLADVGIEVKDIKELEISELSAVTNLFSANKIGMAVDLLRYLILNKHGGIYADLNFKFSLSLSNYLNAQDFVGTVFSSGFLENFFLATKPKHPVIEKTIELVLENINHPPKYFELIENEDTLTNYVTFNGLSIAYYKLANQQGNHDLLYPYFASYQNPNSPVERDEIMDIELQMCPGYEEPELTKIASCIPDYYYNMEVLLREHFFELESQGVNTTIGSDARDMTWIQQIHF